MAERARDAGPGRPAVVAEHASALMSSGPVTEAELMFALLERRGALRTSSLQR